MNGLFFHRFPGSRGILALSVGQLHKGVALLDRDGDLIPHEGVPGVVPDGSGQSIDGNRGRGGPAGEIGRQRGLDGAVRLGLRDSATR